MLQVGENLQVIEVSASAGHLETESSSLQRATSETTIDALPNLNSNSIYYATLQPGVVPANPSFYDTSGHSAFGIGYQSRLIFSSVSVNGGEPQNMDIQLDGVPILGTGYNDATVPRIGTPSNWMSMFWGSPPFTETLLKISRDWYPIPNALWPEVS